MKDDPILAQMAALVRELAAIGKEEDEALLHFDFAAFAALAERRGHLQQRLAELGRALEERLQRPDCARWRAQTKRARAALVAQIEQQQKADAERLMRLQALAEVGNWLLNAACAATEPGYGPRGAR